MSTATAPTRRAPRTVPNKKRPSRPAAARPRTASRPVRSAAALQKRAARLLEAEIAFIANEAFVGRRDSVDGLSDFAAAVELGEKNEHAPSEGLPSHLGRLCSTPLLTPEQEQELFMRMNYCKYRANALRTRLSRSRPNAGKVAEIEDYLRRAERVRNYLIQANTRLVMSIARKYADARNGFDELLSHGVASLMHAVEKFDYSRGYRFSTYATCAVRRDLYRFVVGRKKDFQRFTTGTEEILGGCPEQEVDPDAITEKGWSQLTGALGSMLEELDERERFIVTYRFGLDESGKPSSYSRLGERLGISKERVRQLANRALEKLRQLAPEHRLEALLA